MVIYFKDKNIKDFSYLGSRKIKEQNIRLSQGYYQIQFNNKIESLNGVKLHINRLKLDSIIENISFSIKTKTTEYHSLSHKPVKHITPQAGKYLVTGNDPGFEFNLPKEVQGYSGPFEISIQLKLIDNKNAILNKILHHPHWRYTYSKDANFDHKKTQQAFFDPQENKFVSYFESPKQAMNYFRLYLPAYQNLTLNQFELSTDKFSLTAFDVQDKQDVEVMNNGFIKVTGDDPFIDFNLTDKIKENKFSISFGLGENVE
jgi:hypothetical protein